MEIAIRDWQRSDLAEIGTHWLGAYDRVALPDAPLKHNAPNLMKSWLLDRFRDRKTLGYIAEVQGAFAGFLLGRVGLWESEPPVVRARRIGLIDVVYVAEAHRRRGVGTLLVRRMLDRARRQGANTVETTFEVANPAAVAMWQKLGFTPWIQRAYRRGQ